MRTSHRYDRWSVVVEVATNGAEELESRLSEIFFVIDRTNHADLKKGGRDIRQS